jgi:hypothetical protein
MSFDLNINNYTRDELIQMFELPSNFDKNILEIKEVKLRESINNNISCQIPSDLKWLNTDLLKFDEYEYFRKIDSLLDLVHLHKNKLNKIYSEELPFEIQFPVEFQNWRFNLLVENREKLLKIILRNNLFAGTNYPSISKIFSNTITPKAQLFSTNILNLFNDFRFREADAIKMTIIINKFLK